MDRSLISFNNWIVVTELVRGIIFSLEATVYGQEREAVFIAVFNPELLLASRTLSTTIQGTYNG